MSFVVTTIMRYSGPLLLAVFAVTLVGPETAKSLFVMVTGLLLGITLGKFGVDNQLLKLLADPDRHVGLRLTSIVWVPLTGLATAEILMRWRGDDIVRLGVGVGTLLLLYCVLFLNGVVAALEKSRGQTTYVQLLEFGAFQFLLCAVLAGLTAIGMGSRDSIGTALLICGTMNGLYLVIYILCHPEPFLRREVLDRTLLRERLNCLVPNIITYVSAWGLLLPLAEVPADRFNQLHATLRIATVSTAIISIGNLVGIRDTSLSISASYRRSREISLRLLAVSSPAVIVVYVVGRRIIPGLPDAGDPFVFAIYLIHLLSIFLGPAMFFANVRGDHRLINHTFVGLLVSIGMIYIFPVPGLLGFMFLILYTRLLSRLWLLTGGRGART